MGKKIGIHKGSWPFRRPFYNLKNRFFHNFLMPLKKAYADERGLPYKDKDLLYAAYSRCECGEGLAYHLGTDMHGQWDCAGVLTGRVPKEYAFEKNEDGSFVHKQYPFAFYEIKSEGQPSAQGATTRGKIIPKPPTVR